MYDLGLWQFGIKLRMDISIDDYSDYINGGYKNPRNPIEQYRLSEIDDQIMACNILMDHNDNEDDVNELKSLISKLEDYKIHPEKYFYNQPSIEDLHFNSD